MVATIVLATILKVNARQPLSLAPRRRPDLRHEVEGRGVGDSANNKRLPFLNRKGSLTMIPGRLDSGFPNKG